LIETFLPAGCDRSGQAYSLWNLIAECSASGQLVRPAMPNRRADEPSTIGECQESGYARQGGITRAFDIAFNSKRLVE
jgi:hypothetical protein